MLLSVYWPQTQNNSAIIGCLRTRVRKQPIITLYFESKTILKLYNLEARERQYDPTLSGCFVFSAGFGRGFIL